MSEVITEERPKPSRAKATNRQPVDSPMRLLDLHDLSDLMRLSERTVLRMVSDGKFPQPFSVTGDEARNPDDGSPRARGRKDYRWTKAQYENWAKRTADKAEGRTN